MVAAARLGARVSIMTRVGQDEAGELIISEFKKYGVDTSRIIVQEGYSTPILFHTCRCIR
ncbi:MAG: hypothetical protein JTT13_10975 [Candidatus Brockarchaeota archaeon]|nr:hypothetical protein [Candidatus Brockarchaeota archaeon]